MENVGGAYRLIKLGGVGMVRFKRKDFLALIPILKADRSGSPMVSMLLVEVASAYDSGKSAAEMVKALDIDFYNKEILKKPLSQMPLYVNEVKPTARAIMLWRLKIGR